MKKTIVIFVNIFMFIAIYYSKAQQWQGSSISLNSCFETDIAVDNSGTPYVVYRDAVSGKPTAKKYNGSSWVLVGGVQISNVAVYNPSIAIDGSGTPYVAYKQANDNKIVAKKLIGSSWVTVGNSGFSNSIVNYPSIAIDGSGIPYVVFSDFGNVGGATVMKYNGSSWVTVGSREFSTGRANYTSIAIDGTGVPYVAYQDLTGAGVTVKKYNGSNWVTVGSEWFSSSTAVNTSIAIDGTGTPYVVYQDGGNSDKATVKKYNGSSWVTVGIEGFSTGKVQFTDIAIDGSGTPYVVYKDFSNGNKATVKKYNGSSWVTVGIEGFTGGTVQFTTIAIDGSGMPYVAVEQTYPVVYKYVGDIEVSSVNPLSYCTSDTINVSFTINISFNSGNVFTAQLSDALGSFTFPVNIGTLTGNGAGTINATIPNNTLAGMGYRVRVVSTSPNITSNDNRSNISIYQKPTAPTTLAGTGALVNQFTANWNSVSGATAYILDVATDNAFNSFVSGYNGLNVGNILTKTVTGLPPGPVTYYYRVRATNGSCTGSNSNTITYSTLAPGACPDLIGGTATPQYSIICSGGTKQLTVTGASGGSLQWQVSSDNISWGDISGATSAAYNTAAAGTKKYYRCLTKNSSCYDAASTTAVVEVSNPTITVNVTGKTDNSVTLDWSPVGGGNYDINYDGTSSGSGSSVTPPYTISGLTASGNYNLTVTQTGLSCSASGTLTGVKTLCAVPTGVTLSSPANKQLKVDWTGGAGDYRVYYREVVIQGGYLYKDVTTTGNSGTTTISVMYNGTYEVYVVRKDCPSPGVFGQKSALAHTTVKPLSACTPAPTINEVKSTCPGQIEVSMSGSPTGKYTVFIQRLTPTVAGAYKYNVNGGTFQIHVGQPGQTFAVGVASKCISGTSDMVMYPGGITIKPLCSAINNLILSNPTCSGFTASWNRDVCSENQVSTYQLFMKRTGTLTWNSYKVNSPVAPINPFLKVKWLGKGYEMQCYVKANYTCNGYVIGGPSSATQTITTLLAGCREEENMIEPEAPSTQIVSSDNSEAISIYPNPNNGQFQLDISRMSNDQQQVTIEVMNVLGQTALTNIFTVTDGHGNEIITLPETTAAGTYFVRVTVGSNVYTAMVNVSR